MPGTLPTKPRRGSVATVSLQLVVIGGSIAGLAVAAALQRSGHRVLVLEQTDGQYRSHGLVRNPPNLTRILNTWGLGDALDRVAVETSQFTFRIGATGEAIGYLKFHEQLMKDIGGEMSFIQHGDLQDILMDFAEKAGVSFRFNSKVESIDPDKASVTLVDGTYISADAILGADGGSGITRQVVVSEPCAESPDDRTYLLATIPVEDMRAQPDLIPFTKATELSCWMADGHSALGHLINGGKEYSLCLVVPRQPGSRLNEHWFDNFTVEGLGLNFDAFEPRVRRMLKLATSIIPTNYTLKGSGTHDNWVHESGKVALVGEAAHPLRPNGASNAALAIEDAVTLGTLFSKLHHKEQIPLMFAAFEEIRQPRCSQIAQTDSMTRDFLGLGDGPEQRTRDEGFRHAARIALLDWDDADERYLVYTYTNYLRPFEFSAEDAVDEFWTKWGSWMNRGRQDPEEGLHVHISRSQISN